MDASFWEEVKSAKKMNPEQKFLGTIDLFELCRGLVLSGIRNQFPNASDIEVHEKLLERYRLARRLEVF